MHRILQCNVRHGLQAVLELELPIVAILTDGVVTRCGERAYEDWHKRYTELSTKVSKRWNRVEWDKLGYELEYVPHGPFGSWYPVKKEKGNTNALVTPSLVNPPKNRKEPPRKIKELEDKIKKERGNAERSK